MNQVQSATDRDLVDLIEAASTLAGSQNKLAALLEITGPTLVQMKHGKRPANWRVRGKLRAILGEDPAHAFIAAMAEDLATSTNPEEAAAAMSFRTMLEAFPKTQKTKNPASLSTGGVSVWRKRMFSLLLAAVSYAIDSALCYMRRYAEFISHFSVCGFPRQILSN